MTDAKSVASEVSTVAESITEALPFISTLLGFIPGAQVGVPIVAGVGALLKVLDGAAKAVADGKPNASSQDVLDEVINHLTPGKENSAILS